MNANTHENQTGEVPLRGAIVALTLATAWIHYTLGGTLFLLNAAGYTTLALAMVVPGPGHRFRGVIRLGLIGFTVTTIVGWILFGPRYDVAYVDKAIETLLVALLLLEMWLRRQGPITLARRAFAALSA